jgi:hypothetical protein
MKVVFLDIDGVTHPGKCRRKQVYTPLNRNFCVSAVGAEHFVSDCMDQLKGILVQTNSHIVLSSSWREASTGIQEINAELKA